MASSSSSQRRCVFGTLSLSLSLLGSQSLSIFKTIDLSYFFSVGNIPYDATEEQLREICGEVGPVVSFRSVSFFFNWELKIVFRVLIKEAPFFFLIFRLVTDRETGKPKGYGFCEYKDEETALSARRNLQSYEINGRQLRVDFAENDKGTDKPRDQVLLLSFYLNVEASILGQ